MIEPISDLNILLTTLEPFMHEGVYIYSSVPFETDLTSVRVIGIFRESEGITVILSEADAQKARFAVHFRSAWITLSVNSALHAVGLTAAFSSALAEAGISCNVVAGAFHDHIFVPIERSSEAMSVLRDLSDSSR